MFEKILAQIKDSAIEIVDQQQSVPADKKSVATHDAIGSISEEIDRMMDSGDFSSLEGINNTDSPSNNEAIQNIIASFSKKLQQNSQLSVDIANKTSADIVPLLFVKMKEKFSGGGLDIKTLMSSLSLSDMMKLMSNMGKFKKVFGK